MDMTFDEIFSHADELATAALEDAARVAPEVVGLDARSCPALYLGDDFIAVRKVYDGPLQYYGGFEYVNKDHRLELGGYVFYSAADERVATYLEAQ